MTVNDGFAHVTDTIRFIAVFPDENGQWQAGLSPTVSIKMVTGGSLLVLNGSMTEDSVMAGLYYYSYQPSSNGVYIAKASAAGQPDQASIYVIGDGKDAQNTWEYSSRSLTTFGTLISDIWAFATRTLSAFGFQVNTDISADIPNLATSAEVAAVPADVWISPTRTLTEADGITEAQFHEYLQSYPDSLPAGETPSMPVPPESTSVALIYKYLKNKDGSVLTSATPSCQLLEYTNTDGSAFDVRKESMTHSADSGLTQILVPAYSYVRVIIPEVGMDEVGFVGAGGTSIEPDALFAERQTP